MLTRDTQSTHDAMKRNQLLKGTHDVPEIEILFSKPKKKHEKIVVLQNCAIGRLCMKFLLS